MVGLDSIFCLVPLRLMSQNLLIVTLATRTAIPCMSTNIDCLSWNAGIDRGFKALTVPKP